MLDGRSLNVKLWSSSCEERGWERQLPAFRESLDEWAGGPLDVPCIASSGQPAESRNRDTSA